MGLLHLIKPLGIIGLLGLVFYIGTLAATFTPEIKAAPVITQSVKAELVDRRTVEYVEKPVTVIKTVERVKIISLDLRNYEHVAELERWFETEWKNTKTVYFQVSINEIDCDDYALQLQRAALADGFILSFEIIDRDEYNSLFKTQLPEDQNLHAINLAIIGNEAYYIEPQTGEIVFAVYLD